ncbi:MAG: zinc-dependent alcohol dehydrogenase family protein [Sphaerochaetaceae bacterium]
MKAAVLYGPKNLQITEFPEPELYDNAVKIAVAYCGICGTDFHKFEGISGSRPVTYPVPLGHEVSGVVVEVGKLVTSIKVGDRVTVDPNWSCGNCWYCKSGKRHLCSNSKGVVKGMAEFICPPEENVYLLPDNLSLSDAALTEPLSCCLHGIDLLDVHPGETVAIIGFGAIGQLMLQLLKKISGATIIVIEPVEEKRTLALNMGAKIFLNPNTQDVSKVIKETGIECVEKVMECVGLATTAEIALNIAGKGATVVLFGVADSNSIVPINQYQFFLKELTLKSSYINPNETQNAINLLSNKSIDISAAISKIISLDELPKEIETRHYSRLGKVLVQIRPENSSF